MPNARYVVKEGDTLWDIAGHHLGDPREWPRIYTYNNRADVVRRTGRVCDRERGRRNPGIVRRDFRVPENVGAKEPAQREGAEILHLPLA